MAAKIHQAVVRNAQVRWRTHLTQLHENLPRALRYSYTYREVQNLDIHDAETRLTAMKHHARKMQPCLEDFHETERLFEIPEDSVTINSECGDHVTKTASRVLSRAVDCGQPCVSNVHGCWLIAYPDDASSTDAVTRWEEQLNRSSPTRELYSQLCGVGKQVRLLESIQRDLEKLRAPQYGPDIYRFTCEQADGGNMRAQAVDTINNATDAVNYTIQDCRTQPKVGSGSDMTPEAWHANALDQIRYFSERYSSDTYVYNWKQIITFVDQHKNKPDLYIKLIWLTDRLCNNLRSILRCP